MAADRAPWRDPQERYAPRQRASTRSRCRREAAIWDRALAVLQAAADARGNLDWGSSILDGTAVRAHRSAAGSTTGGDRALGRSRGGCSSQLRVRAKRAVHRLGRHSATATLGETPAGTFDALTSLAANLLWLPV